VPVAGAFYVDLTEPNATITDVNAPDPNVQGVLVVKGTAWDDFFTDYKIFVEYDGNDILVSESAVPVTDSNGVLCTISTLDFNDNYDVNVILKVWDLAGNVGEDVKYSADVNNPDLEPPDVNFHAFWNGSEVNENSFVDSTIDVNVTPTDANDDIKRIELWWGNEECQDQQLITTEEDPNHLPIDVNTNKPWAYQVNPYSFQNGPSCLIVHVWDMFENETTESVQFFNDSNVSNFRVTPSVITPFQTQLTVSASLKEPMTWDINMIDPDSDVFTARAGSERTIHEVFDVNGNWMDGGWVAQLFVGAVEVNAPFTVALSPPVAEISNLVNDTYDGSRDLSVDPLPIVSEGLFELEGAAYHPSTSYDVDYKVTIYQWNVNEYNLVKVVTPGDSDQDDWEPIRVEPYGSLGTLDFSGVENGTYLLRLAVMYSGSVEYATVDFVLDCPLKVGNVKFTQQDLVIPLAGIPLAVIRTYDSLRRNIDSDFGHGWTYSIADMDIKLDEAREPMDDFYPPGGYPESIRLGDNYARNVTLTLPDGRRTTFLFYLERRLYSWRAEYMSPPGVNYTLETEEDENIVYGGVWFGQGVYGSALELAENYDFSGYVLTDKENNTQYYIKRGKLWKGVYSYNGLPVYVQPYGDPYLSHIITAGGEKIDFNVDLYDGKIGKNDKGIEHFSRDDHRNPTGRIQIIYDGGHIAAIKADPCDHFVTDINDARGLTPIRYVYDDQGRLTATIDAKGNTIQLSHDIDGQAETIYNRLGYATTYHYNDRGNIVATTDAMGYTTTNDYNDPLNPDRVTAVTNALGNTTYYEYDSLGRTIQITDPEGNITVYGYDGSGNRTSTVQMIPDPGGSDTPQIISSTTSEYDYRNNLRKTTDALGNSTVYTYDDDKNRMTAVVKEDANGFMLDVVTTYTYDDNSNFPSSPNSITDQAGVTQYFEYDSSGNPTKSWYHCVDPNNSNNYCNVYNITEYDAMGRAVKTIRDVNQVNGNVNAYTLTLSETQYNSIGRPDTTINQYGALTKYEYDHLGNLVETLLYESWDDYNDHYPDYPADMNGILTISQTLFDEEGRSIVSIGPYDPCDPNVNGTETVYDALGRVIETRRWADVSIPIADIVVGSEIVGKTNTIDANGDPNWSHGDFLSKTLTEYDLLGRVWKTKVQDEGGDWQVTKYEYDAIGRQAAVIDPNGNRTEYEYEGTQRVLTRDALGRETRSTYDALGRLVQTTFDDGTYTYTDYDEFGRVSTKTDQAGRTRWFD